MPEPINYPELRKRIGDANSAALMRFGGNVRRKLRLAFDTMIYQYCANEVFETEYSTVKDGGWAGLQLIRRTTKSIEPPTGESVEANELEYIYSLCELGRRTDAEFLLLPTIAGERKHPRHGYYHGAERLDFGIPYCPLPITCRKMIFEPSRPLLSAHEQKDWVRDVSSFEPLIAHLTGKRQRNDVLAFIEAEIAEVDVFVSLDGKFIKPFRQIGPELRKRGLRTRVMRPSELCKQAELQPIPFPPPNPRQPYGSPPPER